MMREDHAEGCGVYVGSAVRGDDGETNSVVSLRLAGAHLVWALHDAVTPDDPSLARPLAGLGSGARVHARARAHTAGFGYLAW